MTSPWKIRAISKSWRPIHVGGYLKIAPEHTEEGPLSKMMKPGMGSYDRFKELFDTYSKQAGKEQYLIPYFISAHPRYA
ncbi:radical SAM superfamily protein [Escherichia coli]|uniref:Radical SAM superfamily protein n=1 Tax=Escherichia coli TaxID=562 RepID=A0A376KL37_ECOLX|nr:radical SAM superfamily protein [Escherichia coli]